MTTSFDDCGIRTTIAELERRYGDQAWWRSLKEAQALNDEEPSVRWVDGPLTLEGDLRTGADPWAIVVDGPLTVSGTLECYTEDARTSTLIVTGPVRAANLFFGSAAQVSVASLDLSGFVIGTWGDSGAWLSVDGVLTARGVLLDSHTPVKAGTMSAIVLAGRGWPGLVPDVIDGENDLFASAVRDRGSRFLDFNAARKAAKNGIAVLEPEQEMLWRQRKRLQ